MTGDDVVLLTLGGTIAMSGRPERGGVVPRLAGADLLAGIPGMPGRVEVRDLRAVPSSDLAFADVLDAVQAAREAVARGARGIVLTQGTDTLEESAFVIDTVWEHAAPFVVTGAMRNPTAAGPDGPANVLAATQVASSAAARGRGVLVVLSEEIHAARFVRKAQSASTATFTSPDVGPIGHVVEGIPRFLTTVTRMPPLTGVSPARLEGTRVALYTATFDDDGLLLDSLDDTHHGLVVAGFGVGHVPGALAPVLGGLATAMPVVLTSRTGAGPVFAHTYGALGSEGDLLARGVVGGGFLHPYKARVLLRLLVAAGRGRDEISARFAGYG